jgi:hypothetical protein
VKPAGRPWHGYDRAVHHTVAYVGWYALAGMIAFMTLSLLLAFVGGTIVEVFYLHMGSVAILFPGAFLVNFAGLRRWPSRSWRAHPGRARLAALLAVFVVWGGLALCTALGVKPPAMLEELIGDNGAWVLHHCGLVVVLSSLSLGLIWMTPPRQ